MCHSIRSHPSLFHRGVAGVSAALVLLLAALAASPSAHHSLHEGKSDHDDGCAVVLFAHGVALAGVAILIAAPLARKISAPAISRELLLLLPRYLHQPERGPPALG